MVTTFSWLAVPVAVFGHGSMQLPRPWNNEGEPAPAPFKISRWNITHVVASGCDGRHRLKSGGETHFPLDTCISVGHGYGSMYSFDAPQNSSAPNIVDCTPDDVCKYGASSAQLRGQESAIWMYQFLNCDPASLTFPLTAFKVNVGHCTHVEISGHATQGCEGQSCEWFSQGCSIGCMECTEENTDFEHNLCGASKEPTLPDRFRTWNLDGSIVPPSGMKSDWTASHPWRSPGNAPVLDACGMAGGSTKDNSGAGGFPPPGHEYGDRGSNSLNSTGTTVWTAGAVVEVAWAISANHGGGYIWRLCPKSEPLTEDCFMKMPLPFVNSSQKLRWNNGTSVEIEASLVSEGTTPKGSTWAKNPIPACKSFSGGFQEDGCEEAQFPPPHGCNAHCWGYQPSTQFTRHMPSIVDTLQLPATLEPGKYVLGFRWDCEQTPQIWNSCSDIEIVPQPSRTIEV